MSHVSWALGGMSRAASLWGVSRPTREKLLLNAMPWGRSFPCRSSFCRVTLFCSEHAVSFVTSLLSVSLWSQAKKLDACCLWPMWSAFFIIARFYFCPYNRNHKSEMSSWRNHKRKMTSYTHILKNYASAVNVKRNKLFVSKYNRFNT